MIAVLLLFQYSVLNIGDLLPLLYRFLPYDLIDPFVMFVMNKSYSSIISMLLSLFVSAYSASNTFYAFMRSSARHENFKTWNILIKMKSILCFFLFFLGFSSLAFLIYQMHLNLQWGTFQKRPWYFGMVGGVVSAISIVLLGYLFFLFIQYFTSYSSVYGPLSSVVILMVSLNWIAKILHFGYCLNVTITSQLPGEPFKMKKFYDLAGKGLTKVKVKVDEIFPF